MALESIYLISLLGLQKDKQSIIDYLHESGVFEIRNKKAHAFDLKEDIPVKHLEVISKNLLQLLWVADVARTNAIEVPETEYETKKVASVLKQMQNTQPVYDQIKQLHEKVTLLTQNETKSKTTYDELKTVHVNVISHPNQAIQTLILKTTDLNYIPHELRKRLIIDQKEHTVLVGEQKDIDAVKTITAQNNIITIPTQYEDCHQAMHAIYDDYKKFKKERAEAEYELKQILQKNIKDFSQLITQLTILEQRYEITNSFQATDHLFYLEAYVSETNKQAVKKIPVKVHIQIQELTTPPTKLTNSWYTSKFSFITKMYGVPAYGMLDPTWLLSFFIPLFFGFMFSDIGYGIMAFMTSITLYYKTKLTNQVIRDAAFVLGICSVSTVIFGALFGSFFGTLIPTTPLLLNPFTDAQLLLVISLAAGAVHLNIAVLLGIVIRIKTKNYRELLFASGSIVTLQLAIVTLFFSRFYGLLLLVLSLVLFTRHNSLMGILDVTGFVGAWFSYSRLLALALATGGIALGINIIAEQLFSLGTIGGIIGFIFLIVGHIVNFALNILGSSIHSTRLHFIEFFSQFYSAQGRLFRPFRAKQIKETL
jgi:vacuolar-type H+-ATPase subunit I/STV1